MLITDASSRLKVTSSGSEVLLSSTISKPMRWLGLKTMLLLKSFPLVDKRRDARRLSLPAESISKIAMAPPSPSEVNTTTRAP